MTDQAFLLERATLAHLAAILAIAGESFESPWSRASFADELARPDGACWDAGFGPRAVGYLLGRVQADELHVFSLAVAPESRRAGCAAALVEAALRDGRARGATRAHLEVRASAVPALACYESAGFEIVGRRAGYYPGGEAALLLSRSLAEGSVPVPVPARARLRDRQRLAGEGG